MASGGSLGEPEGMFKAQALSSKTALTSWFGRVSLNSLKRGERYYRIWKGRWRGKYLQRAVWEHVSGIPLPSGFIIHHMRGRSHNCPESLVALQACLHVHPEPRRDPYTGEYLSEEQFKRRYGKD